MQISKRSSVISASSLASLSSSSPLPDGNCGETEGSKASLSSASLIATTLDVVSPREQVVLVPGGKFDNASGERCNLMGREAFSVGDSTPGSDVSSQVFLYQPNAEWRVSAISPTNRRAK